MSRNNRHDTAFYKSQVAKNNCPAHSARLYTSNAHPSPSLNSVKPNNINSLLPSRVSSRAEKALQSAYSSSYLKNIEYERDLLSRNRSAQNLRWQSPPPARGNQRLLGFRSIVEQMNQNNDKTLEQLDSDLKRIKNSIYQVQQEITLQKKGTESQALYQQIQLLQDENQRLREKNLELMDQKKKMTASLEHYEQVVQKEIAKRQTPSHPAQEGTEDSISQIKIRVELEEKLKQKEAQCQQLMEENSALVKVKSAFDKKESVYSSDKAKLTKTIAELQKQMDSLKLSFEDKLTAELQKKDNYYFNLIKTNEKQYEININSAKSAISQSNLTELTNISKAKQEQIETLQADLLQSKNKAEVQEKELAELSQKLRSVQLVVDSLKNENEFLGFSHQHIKDTLLQKEKEIQQLNQLMSNANEEVSMSRSQTSSAQLQFEQQKNRYNLLQELYNRLEKESNQYESIAQQHIEGYKQELFRAQEDANRLRIELSSFKEQIHELQYRVEESYQQNDNLAYQLNRRNEQILTLKQQNLQLSNEQKYWRAEPVYQSPLVSPPKYERRERFNSGETRMSCFHLRERQNEQIAKIKAMQRQMEVLMKECKRSYQNQKAEFKKKEKMFRQTIEGQKKKIQEADAKAEANNKEHEKQSIEKLKREQQLLTTLHKKEEELLHIENKYKQLAPEIHRLETSIERTGAEKEELKIALLRSQNNEQQFSLKLDHMKNQFSTFLENMLKEMKAIQSVDQDTPFSTFDLYSQIKEINFVPDIRLISHLNFALHNLKEMAGTTNKKMRKLQEEKEQFVQMYAKLEQKKAEEIKRVASNVEGVIVGKDRKVEEVEMIQSIPKEQWMRDLMMRNQELESRAQISIGNVNKLSGELEQQKEMVVSLSAQASKQQEQIEQLELENQIKDKKIRECQQELISRINQETRQYEQNIVSVVTPTKDNSNRESTIFRLQQSEKLGLRQRLRSARHQSPYSKREIQFNAQSGKLLELEMANATLKRNMEDKTQQILNLKQSNRQLETKLKQAKEKVEEKQVQLRHMESALEDVNRQRMAFSSKVSYLEADIVTLSGEIEGLTQKCNQQWTELVNSKDTLNSLEKHFKEEKELLHKSYRNQLLDKDSKMINCTQKHQLKAVELLSQIGALKEKLSESQLKQEQINSKHEKLFQQSHTLKERAALQSAQLERMGQKWQDSEKEREKMLTTFRTNVDQLNKLLEEKEIQIEELKFIQESNNMNAEQVKKQQEKLKQQNSSLFSFQYDE